MNERRLLNAERDAVLKFLKSVNISASENFETIEGQLTLKDEELSFLIDTIQSLKNDFASTEPLWKNPHRKKSPKKPKKPPQIVAVDVTIV